MSIIRAALDISLYHGCHLSCDVCGETPITKKGAVKAWHRYCAICRSVFASNSFYQDHGGKGRRAIKHAADLSRRSKIHKENLCRRFDRARLAYVHLSPSSRTRRTREDISKNVIPDDQNRLERLWIACSLDDDVMANELVEKTDHAILCASMKGFSNESTTRSNGTDHGHEDLTDQASRDSVKIPEWAMTADLGEESLPSALRVDSTEKYAATSPIEDVTSSDRVDDDEDLSAFLEGLTFSPDGDEDADAA